MLGKLLFLTWAIVLVQARPQDEPNIKDVKNIEFHPNGCPVDWDIHHLLAHDTECELFYDCVRGERVLRECAPGTHFNPTLQVCDWPWNAGCEDNNGGGDGDNGDSDNGDGDNGGGDNGGGDNGDGDNGGGDNGGGDNGGGDNGGGDNGGGDNGGGHPLCPDDWDIHHLVPNENDCNAFYYCVRGELVPTRCPAGLHFNPTLQVCDWPWNAGCEDNNGGGDGDNGDGDNGDGDNGGGDNGGGDNGGGDNGGGDNGGGDNGDGDNGGGDNGGGDNGGGDNGGGDNDGGGGGGHPLCPDDWDIHHLVPNENDCNAFYYCVRGELVPTRCPAGLHFNPTLQVCDWPWNAGCEDNNGGGDGDNGDGDNGDGDNGGGDNGGGDNGGGDNGGGDNGDGDNGGGDNGDGDNGGGDNGGGDNGGGDNGGGDNGGGGGGGHPLCPDDWDIHHLVPNENDCNAFYYCVRGELVPSRCPAGLHFNPTIQVCDWPWNAGCEDNNGGGDGDNGGGDGDNGGGDGDNGGGDGDNGGGDGDNGGGDGDNGGGDGDNGGGDGDNEGENRCQNDCHVPHWRHKTDCDKFWRCENNKEVLGVCPEGLHYNVNRQTCDFICNVDCVRNTVQVTKQSDGIRVFLPWNRVAANKMFV